MDPRDEILFDHLNSCLKRREQIDVLCPFDWNQEALRGVLVIEVDPPRLRFTIQRSLNGHKKTFYIGHIEGIRREIGAVVPSVGGQEYVQSIMARRVIREQERTNLAVAARGNHSSLLRFLSSCDPPRTSCVSASSIAMTHKTLNAVASLQGPSGAPVKVLIAETWLAKLVCHLVEVPYWGRVSAWFDSFVVDSFWLEEDLSRGTVFLNHLEKTRSVFGRIPFDLVNVYTAKSWARHQMFKPSDGQLEPDTVRELQGAGLCIPAEQAPWEVLVNFVGGNDLRAILKRLGQITKNRKSSILLIHAAARKSPHTIRDALAAAPSVKDWHCLLPPGELSWDEWQLLRDQHYKMTISLVDRLGYVLD